MNFLIISDSPGGVTGLGRISGDIAKHLAADGHRVFFLALPTSPQSYEWRAGNLGLVRAWPIVDQANYGAADLYSVVHYSRPLLGGGLVIWTIWDATRCGQIVRTVRRLRALWEDPKKLQLWGYFPVDGLPMGGAVDPLTRQVLQGYDRILAYTAFGAGVLRTAHPEGGLVEEIRHLPHGLSEPWTLEPTAQTRICESAWDSLPDVAQEFLDIRTKPTCGVVATNQPRKDLATAIYAAHRADMSLWLHTDRLRHHWDVLNLLDQTYGAADDKENVLLTGHDGASWTDEMLLAVYRRCRVTFAPGLGEGWGYPIAESWAAGVPCVQVAYAGGPEVLPPHNHAGLVEPEPSCYLVGPFGTMRPVIHVGKLQLALQAKYEAVPETVQAVRERLDWTRLWPEVWRPWIEEGFK